ncbi:MAG TPA: hypothetical protein VLA16_00570 [Ideonella sp.]|nr:hypothetical protein [Ideonella sp.]
MDTKASPVEVAVDELKDSRETSDGTGVVLETIARVDGETHDTLIEVKQADAPAVAVALMNVTPDDPPADSPPEFPPALKCLAVGVLHEANGDGIRLHLQLDSGQVLPLEMDDDAAHALVKGLTAHLQGR